MQTIKKEPKEKSETRKTKPESKVEMIQREGNVKCELTVEHNELRQSWGFNALSAIDAIEFAIKLCIRNGFKFQRDAVVWTFQ